MLENLKESLKKMSLEQKVSLLVVIIAFVFVYGSKSPLMNDEVRDEQNKQEVTDTIDDKLQGGQKRPYEVIDGKEKEKVDEVLDDEGINRKDANIYVLDIGQGDSTLIEYDGKHILIDTGDIGVANDVVQLLKGHYNVKEIDKLIVTHWHADHGGGVDKIIENFKVNQLIEPVLNEKSMPTTKFYERALIAANKHNVPMKEAKRGDVLFSIKPEDGLPLVGKVLNDPAIAKNINDSSIALEVTIGDNVLYTMGDCEKACEADVVANNNPQAGKVFYNVSHHGSTTSSTKPIMDFMDADYGFISYGSGNKYGHPHSEVVQDLEARGIKWFGTADVGTIRISLDGGLDTYEITPGLPGIH